MTRRDSKQSKAEAVWHASEQLIPQQVQVLKHVMESWAAGVGTGLERLFAEVLRPLCAQMGAQCVCLRLRDADHLPMLHLTAERRVAGIRSWPKEAAWPSLPRWQDDPLAQEIEANCTAVRCADVAQDPRLASWQEHLLGHGIRCFLAAPLLAGGKVIGLAGLGFAHPRRSGAGIQELAQALAQQVRMAIESAELAERSRQVAVWEERHRMAREIHDTIAQGFTGILAQLTAAEDALAQGEAKETNRYLRRASELAHLSLDEARRSVLALRPQVLAGDGLPAALERVIKQVTPGTGLKAALSLEGQPRPLPPDREAHLLRIGQEALTNALKHARASHFQARLIYRRTKVLLHLHDNGRGFDPGLNHNGLGLIGIKERVKEMGGQLSIKSASGIGTGIFVTLPTQAMGHTAAA